MAKRIIAARAPKGKVGSDLRARITDHEVRLLREPIGSFIADGMGTIQAYRDAANYIGAHGMV